MGTDSTFEKYCLRGKYIQLLLSLNILTYSFQRVQFFLKNVDDSCQEKI